jgi:hypothetical protein
VLAELVERPARRDLPDPPEPDHLPEPVGTLDRQLVALAYAANNGRRCPHVTLLVGSRMFAGRPVASSAFIEKSWLPLLDSHDESSRKGKVDPDAERELLVEALNNVRK